MGEVKFEAGFKAGEGMTKKYQIQIHKGKKYGDTPGLEDIKIRDIASKEITKILKLNGIYQLIFVLTLEAGRVRPGDVSTINLVLDSIQKKVPFGVIINKCTEVFVKKFNENFESTREKVVAAINFGKHKTESIYFFEKKKSMVDKSNVVVQLPNELIQFISTVPSVCIYEDEVGEIQINQFDNFKNELEKNLNHFIDDDQKRNQMMKESISVLNENREIFIKNQEEQFKEMQKKKDKLQQDRIDLEERYQKMLEEQKQQFLEKLEKADQVQKQILENERNLYLKQMQIEKEKNELQLAHMNQLYEERLKHIQECNKLNSNRKSTLETFLSFTGGVINTVATGVACSIF